MIVFRNSKIKTIYVFFCQFFFYAYSPIPSSQFKYVAIKDFVYITALIIYKREKKSIFQSHHFSILFSLTLKV
jgi:hypothetical protein